MSSKHTLGPWVAAIGDTMHEVYSADDSIVRAVVPMLPNRLADQSQANAHLIAAAPAMYEALVSAKVILEFMGLEGTGNYKNVCGAIAKAEGRV